MISRKETLVCMSNEVNKTIPFWRLQCFYYGWVKDTIEMTSSGMICVPSLMKIGSGIQTILRFCLSNLGGYDVGIIDERDFMKYAVEMASNGMIYILSFMKIGTGVQAILRF
jgi:hypothetical protein